MKTPLSISLFCCFYLLGSEFQEESSRAMRRFISLYQPSPTRCSPSWWIDPHNPEEQFNKEFACLLSGYKDVLWKYLIKPLPSEIISLAAEKNLNFLLMSISDETNIYSGYIILFTERGRENAYILAKSFVEWDYEYPWYLYGHLLGYPENEIHTFTISSIEREKLSDNPATFFYQIKTESLTWINQHRPTIHQWFSEYCQNLSIYLGNFNNQEFVHHLFTEFIKQYHSESELEESEEEEIGEKTPLST